MASKQKIGSCKKLARSARLKTHNERMRSIKISRTRKRKLSSAERNSGKEFAEQLKKYYLQNPSPPKKVS